ncbi:MAG TPA: Na+ dependent nucleoside transporter N-terminal domain-containing protein, partial [Flavobacteriales bacterium]|nr:Na+ dependent nucleoside transporter N-terminal domain-containing protein [Flavobacteriales bacterium]
MQVTRSKYLSISRSTLVRIALLLLIVLPLPAFAQAAPLPLTGLSLSGVLRGILGMATIVAISWVFSAKRKHVDWKVVGIGL